MRRRDLLGLAGGSLISLSGCSGRFYQFSDNPNNGSGKVTGVITGDAEELADAEVIAYREGQRVARTTTNADGSYNLSLGQFPAWVQYGHAEYASVTRAVAPNSTLDLDLIEKDNSVSLVFGGDVMFGRRYYEPKADPLRTYYQLQRSNRRNSHERLLDSVSPILSDADVASINLETPLTTSQWRHPSKSYVFTSHPISAPLLADSGVNYAALANTHAFDALTPGLEETVGSLDDAGIAHSGAGFDPSAAATPAFIEREGVTVGIVSATTTSGKQYENDWAAEDSDATYTIEQNGETLTVPERAGVADATIDSVRASVQTAADRADIVVAQIHGGEEYQRTPTPELRSLTEAAVTAGADLVVNHHPHVSGGFETLDGALVAWSMGNLFFDQNLWTTYRSMLLQVDVSPDGVRAARVEPILIEGYVPRGVTGTLRRRLTWELAGYSDDSFSIEGDTLTWLPDGDRPDETSLTLEGGVQRRNQGWITESPESVQVGRERFITSSFDDHDVDSDRYEGTLWRYGRSPREKEQPLGRDGSGGVELVRVRANENRALLSPWNRIPVDNEELGLSGTYRTNADGQLRLLVSWFDDTSGGSFQRQESELPSTDREWHEFSRELQRPDGATHLDVFVFLEPPEGVEVLRAAFDRLSLVEWEPSTVGGGREYDAVRGPAGETVRIVPTNGEVLWQ